MSKRKTLRRRTVKPMIEALEDRCVLSAIDHTGTVTLDSREFLWKGESVTAHNVAYRADLGGPCGKTVADYCETTLLHVDVDPAYWATHEGDLQIEMFPERSGPDDFDMFVYQTDATGVRGERKLSQLRPAGVSEVAAINQPAGYYLVDIVYYDTSQSPVRGDGYIGAARLMPACASNPTSFIGLHPVTCDQYQMLPQPDRFVSTRFGDLGEVRVYTRVWLPSKVLGADALLGTADDERVPVVFAYGPYGVPSDRFLRSFVPKGYALVVADTAGTGGSGGCYDFYGKREQQSAYDMVEWAAAQPWSNGKVGMYGASAYGGSAMMTAASNPPHLATIVTAAAFSSVYDALYGDGVRYSGNDPDNDAFIVPGGQLIVPATFDFRWGTTSGEQGNPSHPVFRRGPLTPPPDRELCPSEKLDHTVHGYNLDPDYDAFWQERNWFKDAAKLATPDEQEISVLVQGGWEDKLLRPSQQLRWFESIPVDNPSTPNDEGVPFKMLRMDAVGHTGLSQHVQPQVPGAEFEWETLVHAWFDQFLYGYDTGVTNQPVVMSKGSDLIVREALSWAVPGTADVNLFLRESGALSSKPPHPHAPESLGTYFDTGAVTEAQVLAQRDLPHGDFLWFESDVLQVELRLAGHPTLKLLASTSTTSTHFTPVLFDIAPDGSAARITGGFLNARYKGGLEQGHDLVPGESYKASVRFEDNDYIIPAGHRFGLAVMSSNTEWAVSDQQRATNSIFSEHGNRRSTLILPIVGGEDALKAALPDNDFTDQPGDSLADLVNALSGGDSAPMATNSLSPTTTSLEVPTSLNALTASVEMFFAAMLEEDPNTAIFPSTQVPTSVDLEGDVLTPVLPLI